KLAALYLKSKGLTILEMNRSCLPYGEIDIIAKNKNELVFVEVKTAYKSNPDSLDEKVDNIKLTKMVHAIQHYQNQVEQIEDFRIDCISVILQKNKPFFKHFEGILLD
ncbi:MAG: YraN family protein, partial [Candidatus Marinimicrobia bacterium]|nr:YraN family protein [Candidatus Neomarinimicrobiota bacterium]